MSQAAQCLSASQLNEMDNTVAEIFTAMLQIECPPTHVPEAPGAEVRARVRFSGALEGECIVSFSRDGAASLAEAFLGGAADDVMIGDAVGELCNMLAGAWKRRLGPEVSTAGLSVPEVTRVAEANRLSQADTLRAYEFAGTQFTVRLDVALPY